MSTGSSAQVTRRGVLPRLRDAKIRSKLGLILFVPLLAVAALGAARLVDISNRASSAGQIQRLTKLATNVSTLVQLLQDERMVGARLLAGSKDPANVKPLDKSQPRLYVDGDVYHQATLQTDAVIAQYQAARKPIQDAPAAVQDVLNRIDDHLTALETIRGSVGKRDGISLADEVSRYGVVITDMVGYDNALSQYAGDGDVADGLRALAAFARAKAGAADQEATAYAGRILGDNSTEQRTAVIATETSQQEAMLAFALAAGPTQSAVVDNVVTGDAVSLADSVTGALTRDPANVKAHDIVTTYGAVVDLMRWAEQQLESGLLDQTAKQRASVLRQAVVESVLVALAIGIAVLLAFVLARSLNESLRRLREGALRVANNELPEAVARLRDAQNIGEGGALDILRHVGDSIQLDTRDEVGQVAQAFNVVHREAVRIAAEQAALRTSVSAMFLNLARRSQSLVDRMIGELDQIERNETDPKRLAQLFELDHLATRMRRNDENLLVLAGADSSPPRREDALLVDAMRAAQSEVELYNRIEFGTVDTDIAIAAHAVNDVVRLVAELLDNATRFSPPTTIVVADGRRIRDYVVIQVEDRGLGMSDDQMEQLNARLAEPPGVDVAAFRLMGLAVVSRLAARYGIRVELRANLEGGTIAQVVLPNPIVVAPERQLERAGSARHATPELGAGPGWEGSRSATATLPALEPRQFAPPAPSPSPFSSAPLPSSSPFASAPEPRQYAEPTAYAEPRQYAEPAAYAEPQQYAEPEPEPAVAAHPLLPQFPSQRTPANTQDAGPTPNRPPLPTRVAKAISDKTVNGFASAPHVSPPVSAPPFTAPAPPFSAPPEPVREQQPAREDRWGAALAAMPPVPPPPVVAPAPERTESPIFVEMQQSWFKDHEEGAAGQDWGLPTAGRAPEPAVREKQEVNPPSPAGNHSSGHNGHVSAPRSAADERWQTAADFGWERAMAAAEPADAGTTRSGLPKRVPQAQLVPGGVQGETRPQKRRSPDEVRGLLSAYHRGVQRGRTDGSAEAADAPHALKENDQ